MATSSSELLTRLWAKPDDAKLRLVLADLLQEEGDPWGELIALQSKKGKRADVARLDELKRTLVKRIAGPLAKVSAADSLVLEGGFVTALTTLKSATRAAWEAAAEAPHWAMVKDVRFDLGTPRWFTTKWAANPNIAHVQRFSFGRGEMTTLRLARDGRGWRVTYDRRTSDNFRLLRAMQAGLPEAERAKFEANSEASLRS